MCWQVDLPSSRRIYLSELIHFLSVDGNEFLIMRFFQDSFCEWQEGRGGDEGGAAGLGGVFLELEGDKVKSYVSAFNTVAKWTYAAEKMMMVWRLEAGRLNLSQLDKRETMIWEGRSADGPMGAAYIVRAQLGGVENWAGIKMIEDNSTALGEQGWSIDGGYIGTEVTREVFLHLSKKSQEHLISLLGMLGQGLLKLLVGSAAIYIEDADSRSQISWTIRSREEGVEGGGYQVDGLERLGSKLQAYLEDMVEKDPGAAANWVERFLEVVSWTKAMGILTTQIRGAQYMRMRVADVKGLGLKRGARHFVFSRSPCGVTQRGTGITEKLKVGTSMTTNLAPFHPNVSVNVALIQGLRGYIHAAFFKKRCPSTNKLVSTQANTSHFNTFLWVNESGKRVDKDGYGDFNKVIKETVGEINEKRSLRGGTEFMPFTGGQHRHMMNQLMKDAAGEYEEERRGEIARLGRQEGAMAGHAPRTGGEYTDSGFYSNDTHGPVTDDDANLLYARVARVWKDKLKIGVRYTGQHSVEDGSTSPAKFANNFGKGSWWELVRVTEEQKVEDFAVEVVREMARVWVKGALWQAELAVFGEEGARGGVEARLCCLYGSRRPWLSLSRGSAWGRGGGGA